MTPAQLRMWAGQQMHPEAPIYNMALSFRIFGELKADHFAVAFDRLVADADALRMVVVEEGARPSLQVLPYMSADLQQIDLTCAPNPQAAATAWMQTRSRIKFDLTVRNFDSALLRLANAEWIWFYNQHHMFTDASSFAVLHQRLSELYSTRSGVGAKPCLPEFKEFVTGPMPASQDDAAKQYFSDTGVLLPRLYGQRSSSGETRSRRLRVALNAKQAEVLHERAAVRPWAALTPQMSQYNMIATVLFAFLFRISDQASFAIGAPVHNRTTPEKRRMAGLLIDVLPMSVHCDADDSFTTLFEKVRSETGLLLRHAMSAPQDGNPQRRFNVVLNFITAQFGDFAGFPSDAEWLHSGHCDANHHLRLQVEDFNKSGELRLFLDLNRAIFQDPEATLARFAVVLEAFLTDPDQPISAIPLASAAERTQIEDFSAGQQAALEQVPVTELIAQQCARTPEIAAISFGSSRLSYAELDALVTALCATLQARGVVRGTKVALVLPRSPAAVVAMIAVMRCGAAYVPIDPTIPPDRARFIIKDAECIVSLTCDITSQGSIVIDENGSVQETANAAFAPVKVVPEDTAYILYTSGSTGKPKGVIVPHRGLSHYVGWACDTYCGDRGLTFPLFSPLTFDLTVTSIFVPLVSGGTIRVYREPLDKVDTSLLDVVAEDVVDIIKLTPSHLRLLTDRNLSCSRVCQLIVGGEDFPAGLAHDIHTAFGEKISIHNEYGPTEATVGCILHTFDPNRDLTGSVPIGRPITNMTARILNSHGQKQLPGVPGELHLSGAGIADGYHKRPDLTAKAFIDGPDGSGRTYRTGDLAVFRDDGRIDYLGRIDQQVKINGVRVETTEIEAVMAELPEIDAACVVLNQNTSNRDNIRHCVACGLPSNFPDIYFDQGDLCSICQEFANYESKAQGYFQDMPRLRALLDSRLPSVGSHDGLVLFSGGKDSTYMLGRLADMGLNVLAFTLDNGFISDQAKANIDRVVTALGIDHVYKTVSGMNEIFADSLRRHANVCNGCFKTIYTLGMQLANERDIPFVFTGLSRGQFFETRLSPEAFGTNAPSAADIDALVLEARKSYHRTDDAVSKCLDVSAFQGDGIFERVSVVDFYRYCDVNLGDLYDYLDVRLPWVRPSDTGRSTNCRVNDVGIYVHKKERGYHNYALPYSWDVRMGHKDRNAALAELDDDIDVDEVEHMLSEIGYRVSEPESPPAELVAYYAARVPCEEPYIRSRLSQKLPAYMVPAQFVHLQELPLSRNGKVDRSALPEPPKRQQTREKYLKPRTEAEQQMAAIWEDVLGVSPVGADDDFFDLGGDSVAAIRINTRAIQSGFELRPNDIFEALTVARLVALLLSHAPETEEAVEPGPLPLMPAQRWFLGDCETLPPVESQVATISSNIPIGRFELLDALRRAIAHHDALKTAFETGPEGWAARLLAEAPDAFIIEHEDAQDEALLRDINLQLDPAQGRNVAAAIRQRLGGTDITLAVHHLVVDAASWPLLLQALSASLSGVPLPRKTVSLRQWAEELHAIDETARAPWISYLKHSTTDLPQNLAGINLARTKHLKRARCTVPGSELARIRAALSLRGASVTSGVLTALALALASYDSPHLLRIAVEGAGRTEPTGRLNASRTVGWFTAFEPFVLPIPDDARSADPLQTLSGVTKSEAARPVHAAGADVLRQRGLLPLAEPELVVNILDGIDLEDGPLRVKEPLRLWQDPEAPVHNGLVVNVALLQKDMEIELTGPCDLSVLDQLSQDLRKAFTRLSEALPRAATRSSEQAMGQANLNKLAALIDQKGRANDRD